MRKKIIIKVTTFETQIISEMLKKKAEKDEIDLFIVERDENTLSDKNRRDIMTGYIGGSQDVCINYEPTEEEEEALCLKDRISLFDDDDERFSYQYLLGKVSTDKKGQYEPLLNRINIY